LLSILNCTSFANWWGLYFYFFSFHGLPCDKEN